jgi:hypothetical protein
LGEIGKEDDGFGFWIGLVGQNRMMPGGMVTEDELSSGSGLDAEELGADRHASIRADLDGSAQAPDERPPGAARDGTQNAAFLLLSQVPSPLGFHLEFAVNFVLVAMPAQVLDVGVGLIDVRDLFAGEVSG